MFLGRTEELRALNKQYLLDKIEFAVIDGHISTDIKEWAKHFYYENILRIKRL